MRVYTKVVWQWRGDELVQVEAESYEYNGPVDLCKGGSSGPDNYANLDRLYGIQADQAEFLGNTFKNTVAPAYKGWLGEAQDYGSQANQEDAAQRAGKAASGAISDQQHALEGNLASMGINPADARYAQGMREMGIQGAAQQAAAQTTARDSIRDKGFARMQDAIGMGMGTPTQASQAANSAANSATSSLDAQNRTAQNQSNSVGNIMRAGTNIYSAYNNPGSGMADGGEVQKHGILRLNGGGYVQRLKQGGFAGGGTGGGGFMAMPSAGAPPPGRAPAPSAGEQGVAMATTPAGMGMAKQGIGKAAEMAGNASNSPGVTAFGRGMQLSPADARAGAQGYKESLEAAKTQVNKALGPSPGDADTILAQQQAGQAQNAAALDASQVGATSAGEAEQGLAAAQVGEAATTDAAAAAAEQLAAEQLAAQTTAAATETGLAASGAGMGAAAAVGTAVPVIGAGLALYGIGNAAGWWADGGQVQPGGPPKMSTHDLLMPGPVSQKEGMNKFESFSPGARTIQFGQDHNWWADGGEITPGSRNQTGEVDGPGGPKDDEVLAALSDGEFVMPVGAVKYFGIDRMEKMRQKGLEHEKQLGIGR